MVELLIGSPEMLDLFGAFWDFFRCVYVLTKRCFINYNYFTEMVKVVILMKQHYTKNQYLQIAKDTFCNLIKTVPFVSDIEIVPVCFPDEFGDFHAIVHYEDTKESQRFCIMVKSNGEKRFVNLFIKMAEQYVDDNCYVFMAPYISDVSEECLVQSKFSYIDLSGNCYVLAKRMVLHFKGNENKYLEKRSKKNYLTKSSSAASAILRTMLSDPYKLWQVISLANASGKAIGTVFNVKSFLNERDWIEQAEEGKFRLQHIKELLYAWAKDYHIKDARTFEYYSLDSIAEMEQKISAWSVDHDNSALLGGFSAAARYAPTVRYKRIDVYVESQVFNEFIFDMDLQKVESGGNVIVMIPHDKTPYMFYETINGDMVTSAVQTVLDLLGNPGRGEEAADAIISKRFRR